MQKITSLTKAQTEAMATHRDKWIAIGLSTERADRKLGEASIRAQYEMANIKCPHIFWVSSPLVGALAAPMAANLIAAHRGSQAPQKSAVDSAVYSAVESAVRSAVYSAVYSAVDSAVDSAVRSAVDSAVDSAVRSAVGSAVRSAVDSAVYSAVESAVDSAKTQQLWWHRWMGGQFWAWWPAYMTYYRDVLKLDLPAGLKALEDDRASQCYWWPNRDFVFACERPVRLERDSQGRLHSLSGQAIQWSDGWGLYRIHGVAVPAKVVEAPETLTIVEIEGETNAEVRRVMLDRYGAARFLLESGAKEIGRDAFGILYRKELNDDEPLVMVRVLNSTAEPDGPLTRDEAIETFGVAAKFAKMAAPDSRWKEYSLRVPPTMRTAHEAVAWINHKTPADYAPQVET